MSVDISVYLLSPIIALILFNLTTTFNTYKKINKICERLSRIEATLEMIINGERKKGSV